LTTKSLTIGIDTGGTYTDAVVVHPLQRKILAAAKAITTKGDLSIGIGEALDMVMQGIAQKDVAMVSVSTTLATNAVVEGHGSSVGMIFIGFDAQMIARTGISKAYPGTPIIAVVGGHDHNGAEIEPLDEARLKAEAAAIDVSAFAVASSFAVRNPAHEIRARDILSSLTNKPVTISKDLSTALDAPRRALTAMLNARLIARIAHLIEAVEASMQSLGLDCPLMVVKGDGSLARAEEVALRPLETVLSGPAASLIGAKFLSGLDDFIMSDIGGTTTDVGVMLKSRPRIAEEGASVGGFRTMVQAIDVETTGLGGDSDIGVNMDGSFSVGPERAVPLSLIAHRHPEILGLLEAELAENDGWSLHGRFVVPQFGGVAASSGLSPREADMLAGIGGRLQPFRKLGLTSGAQRAIASLRRRGLVQVSSFTPSDAAHVLGLQANWNADAARLGAKLIVRTRTMKQPTPDLVEAFCREVRGRVITQSARAILSASFDGRVPDNPLIDAVCEGRPMNGLVRLGMSPIMPVVAVGGPARIYYEEVGRRLGCPVVFTENFQVANAVGAAAGLVGLRVTVTVEGDGSGAFRVFSQDGAKLFSNGIEALAFARGAAAEIATRDARSSGAKAPAVTLTEIKSHLPDAVDDNGLLSARIVADAVAAPVA
jgi:N-methylhydantoinase A/oxoprolinase/acetone carboxylase beta subunit